MWLKLCLSLLAAIACLACSAPARAATALLPGDADRGKALHAAQCVACHDSKVYTRDNRRVKSAPALIKQVEFCNQQLKKELSRDQINDLIAYLNETYYRFE